MATKKRKPAAAMVLSEVMEITGFVVENGLADDQNFPFRASRSTGEVVHHPNALPFASMLRERPYREMYTEQLESRSYNVRMLDGALVQMVYDFDPKGKLTRHRLAFLPSPDLLEFQNHPELYLEEILYADVVDKRAVAVPLRFDYDGRDEVYRELEHPRAHLTLGQYTGCRIAATAPLTPSLFMDLILRNFYSTATSSLATELRMPRSRFDVTISEAESDRVHVGVPHMTSRWFGRS